jgi:hypothetical protein
VLFNFVHISNQSPDYRRENPQNPWEAIGETNPQNPWGGAQAPQPGKTGSLSRKNISKFIQKTTLV